MAAANNRRATWPWAGLGQGTGWGIAVTWRLLPGQTSSFPWGTTSPHVPQDPFVGCLLGMCVSGGDGTLDALTKSH